MFDLRYGFYVIFSPRAGSKGVETEIQGLFLSLSLSLSIYIYIYTHGRWNKQFPPLTSPDLQIRVSFLFVFEFPGQIFPSGLPETGAGTPGGKKSTTFRPNPPS